MLTSQGVTDFVHFGGWDGGRDSCDPIRSGEDYGLCLKSSWLCDELPILLHWQVSLTYYFMPNFVVQESGMLRTSAAVCEIFSSFFLSSAGWG